METRLRFEQLLVEESESDSELLLLLELDSEELLLLLLRLDLRFCLFGRDKDSLYL